jgi:Tol biopolymer transport system component
MTELEDRIRQALQDPLWELPVWPDPMRRVRRAAARQRARLAAATVILTVAIVTPLSLLPGLVAHLSGVRPPADGASPTPSARSSAASVPSWAKRLHGEVTYQCGGSICLMRPDGTGKRALTAAFPGKRTFTVIFPQWDPAWSPDGRRLTFRGYFGPYEGDFAVYVAGANNCHLTKLSGAMNGTNPSWSPSGRQIAFAVGGINVINADGTGLRGLTSDLARSGRDRYDDEDPAWSASNRIAFVRTRMGTSRGEIYAMNADGSGLAPLTHGGPGFEQPSWSPDGRQIAFVATAGHFGMIASRMVIEVANADGTGMHKVSPPSWASYSPTWTPGGKIVFLRAIADDPGTEQGGQLGIAPTQSGAAPASAYIVNRNGSGLRLLYPKLNAMQIAWGAATLPRATC